jgi:hypothetical protein
MRRRTFDILMSAGGLMLTLVLVIAGALAFVGYNFANSNVEDQLRAQNIMFPPAGPAIEDPRIKPFVEPYAGQQLVTGEQARVYADHYIAVHLADAADGLTYAEASSLSRQNPGDETLAAQVQTLFRGETLRGLLLNAYAFWKLGQIAKLAGTVAFGLAAIMAILTLLGFWHLRRVEPEEEILTPPVGLQRKTA